MEEYFDVVDENNVLTGQKALRSEAHAKGLWHRTVHVWILNSKNELLVQLRSPLKINDPNLWDISSAGHISAGEDGKTSALREVKEELGIDITLGDLEYIGQVKTQDIINNNTYFDNEIHEVYLVHKDFEISDLNLQKEEVADAKWVNFLELEKDIKNNPNKYVDHSEEFGMLFGLLKAKL